MKVKFTPAGVLYINGNAQVTKRITTLQITPAELHGALMSSGGYGVVRIDDHKPHVIYRIEIV